MKKIKTILSYSVADAPLQTTEPADTPAKVLKFLDEYRTRDREHFIALYLNSRSSVIAIEVVSVGTVSASLVHPREVFKGAILFNAATVIVAHNHPSGDPEPSAEDRECTRRLRQAGELLGIPLIDHIVMGKASHVSFRDRGLI